MYFIPYTVALKEYSRRLRNRSTLGELLLWNELKAGKMLGYKFNRQLMYNNRASIFLQSEQGRGTVFTIKFWE